MINEDGNCSLGWEICLIFVACVIVGILVGYGAGEEYFELKSSRPAFQTTQSGNTFNPAIQSGLLVPKGWSVYNDCIMFPNNSHVSINVDRDSDGICVIGKEKKLLPKSKHITDDIHYWANSRQQNGDDAIAFNFMDFVFPPPEECVDYRYLDSHCPYIEVTHLDPPVIPRGKPFVTWEQIPHASSVEHENYCGNKCSHILPPTKDCPRKGCVETEGINSAGSEKTQ